MDNCFLGIRGQSLKSPGVEKLGLCGNPCPREAFRTPSLTWNQDIDSMALPRALSHVYTNRMEMFVAPTGCRGPKQCFSFSF